MFWLALLLPILFTVGVLIILWLVPILFICHTLVISLSKYLGCLFLLSSLYVG